MKIRTKLTLRYLIATAAVFSVFVLIVYLFSKNTRETEFYRELSAEGVTKAHLFLSGEVDAGVMQSTYLNNREFIEEVEVAIYDMDFGLVYHDAQDIDIVKETPELMREVIHRQNLHFYEDRYQVVAMVYDYGGRQYVITAAAYDRQGKATVGQLAVLLLLMWVLGMVVLAVLGYLMARSALSPVAKLADEAESITDTNLDTRLAVKDPNDELGELAETFNRMLDRLEKSFDAQKLFVSNVSHELRTPLAALIAELEVTLLKERTPEQYRDTIAKGLADARKLERLSSGLLDMARANYDPGRISMENIRLDELVLDARGMVIRANVDYTVEIIFDQEPEDERQITVFGNEYLLKTAFINLIENNCKFSDNHASRISISYYDQNAVVRFSDSGRGMTAEESRRAFEPFYRASAEVPGHGIGMALVGKIVTIHGGEISIQSQPGEGTSFVCAFPHIFKN